MYGCCLYFSKKKMGGSPLKYWRGVFSNFENVSNERRFDLKCSENKSKMNYSLKVALGVSPQFFSIWTRVLNHNKYVEIEQFSKEDIKQNYISTVILLIKFLVYQWDPRHLQGSRVVYIFIYTLYSCSI